MTCVNMVLTMTTNRRTLLDPVCQDVLRLVWDCRLEDDDEAWIAVESNEAFVDTVVALVQLVLRSGSQRQNLDDIPRELWDVGTLADVRLDELSQIFRSALEASPVNACNHVIESVCITEEDIEWLFGLEGVTVRRSVVYLWDAFDDLYDLQSVTFDRCEIRFPPNVSGGPYFNRCTFSEPWGNEAKYADEPEQIDETLDDGPAAPTSPDVVPTGGRRD